MYDPVETVKELCNFLGMDCNPFLDGDDKLSVVGGFAYIFMMLQFTDKLNRIFVRIEEEKKDGLL